MTTVVSSTVSKIVNPTDKVISQGPLTCSKSTTETFGYVIYVQS